MSKRLIIVLVVLAAAAATAVAQDHVSPVTPRPPSISPSSGQHVNDARVDAIDEATRQAHLFIRQKQAQRAIDLLAPLLESHEHDSRLITALATAYLENDEPKRAIALLEGNVRQAEGKGIDLWMLLARAHGEAGEGRAAVEALLECTREQPLWAMRLRDQFELLARDSVSGADALRALEEAASTADAPQAWREILAHLYVVTGQGDRALDMTARVDAERNASGRMLLPLAMELAERGSPAHALAAFDSTLARTRDPKVRTEALYERGLLLEREKRLEEAAASYAQAESSASATANPIAMKASVRRAQLLLTGLRRPVEARAVYERLISLGGRIPDETREAALLGVAECALREHDFVQAGERFADLERNSRGEARERAAYERAEMLFYAGQMAEAEEAYYALTDSFPLSVWMNDALERVLLLGEHAQAGELLSRYAGLAFLRRVGEADSALAVAQRSLTGDAGMMRDDFRVAEIEIQVELGQLAAADSSLAHLLADDGESRLAPDAMLLVAQRFESEPPLAARVRELYETLVLRYPASLASRQARLRLQAIRTGEEPS